MIAGMLVSLSGLSYVSRFLVAPHALTHSRTRPSRPALVDGTSASSRRVCTKCPEIIGGSGRAQMHSDTMA